MIEGKSPEMRSGSQAGLSHGGPDRLSRNLELTPSTKGSFCLEEKGEGGAGVRMWFALSIDLSG